MQNNCRLNKVNCDANRLDSFSCCLEILLTIFITVGMVVVSINNSGSWSQSKNTDQKNKHLADSCSLQGRFILTKCRVDDIMLRPRMTSQLATQNSHVHLLHRHGKVTRSTQVQLMSVEGHTKTWNKARKESRFVHCQVESRKAASAQSFMWINPHLNEADVQL